MLTDYALPYLYLLRWATSDFLQYLDNWIELFE